jgi:hypothetical protein
MARKNDCKDPVGVGRDNSITAQHVLVVSLLNLTVSDKIDKLCPLQK